MKVLIVGGRGQLGSELLRTRPASWDVVAPPSTELDIVRPDQCLAGIERHKPDAVINASAYTKVDLAEEEREAAYAINATGPANLAEAARRTGAGLLHVSTDFVFDGSKSRPYLTTDRTRPLSVYGASKLEGEERIRAIYGDEACIIRTAWLYSASGNNFVKTMLRLGRERDRLRIVADQIGTPTWARGLAEAVWQAVAASLQGLYHFTDAGVASWFDFAVAVCEEGRSLGLMSREVEILPIATEDYPTPARRPPYSVLDKSRLWEALPIPPIHWRVQLREMLKEIEP